MAGFLLDEEQPSVTRVLGAYELDIALDAMFQHKAEIGYGLVIATGPEEFVGVGSGFASPSGQHQARGMSALARLMRARTVMENGLRVAA